MKRRKFSRAFGLNAVKLVRRLSGAGVARSGVHAHVLRTGVRELETDAAQAFSGHEQVKPEHVKIDRLRKAVTKLEAERDILEKR